MKPNKSQAASTPSLRVLFHKCLQKPSAEKQNAPDRKDDSVKDEQNVCFIRGATLLHGNRITTHL